MTVTENRQERGPKMSQIKRAEGLSTESKATRDELPNLGDRPIRIKRTRAKNFVKEGGDKYFIAVFCDRCGKALFDQDDQLYPVVSWNVNDGKPYFLHNICAIHFSTEETRLPGHRLNRHRRLNAFLANLAEGTEWRSRS